MDQRQVITWMCIGLEGKEPDLMLKYPAFSEIVSFPKWRQPGACIMQGEKLRLVRLR